MKSMKKANRRQTNGFTLLESMMSVLILTLILGAIFRQIHNMQANYKVEGQKIDLSQQDREFIDQFTRDLHQAGYPSPATLNITNLNAVVDPAGGNPNLVSAGITNISATSLTMEGDLDGMGTVKVVTYTFSGGAGCPGGRPCVLRTVNLKGAGGGAVPYVEVQNLVAGSGGFAAYDNNGQAIVLPEKLNGNATVSDSSYKNLKKIKSVTVALTLQSTGRDINGGVAPQVSMTGTARLPNN